MPRKQNNFVLPTLEPATKIKLRHFQELTGPQRKEALDGIAKLLIDRLQGTDFRYLIGRLQEILPTALNTDDFAECKAELESNNV